MACFPVKPKQCAGLNENKGVSFSKNSWAFKLCLSLQVWKKEAHVVHAKKCRLHLYVLYPFNRQIQRAALWYVSIRVRLCTQTFQPCFQFPRIWICSRFNFLWCFYSVVLFFGFLHHCHCKTLHLHPVLHPITLCCIQSAVVLQTYAFSLFTILGFQTVAVSDKVVFVDCSKACICFVHWSRLIKSWLDNIDEFRYLTAEIASVTTMFWPCQIFFVKSMRATWSETRQTGYLIGVIDRLESALDLVKKMEQAKERHWRESGNESILKEFPKPSR